MERRKIFANRFISPSMPVSGLAVAGESSSQVVGDNFSDPSSNLKASIWFGLSARDYNVRNPYELPPLPEPLPLHYPFDPPVSSVTAVTDLIPLVESSSKRLRPSAAPPNPSSLPFVVPILRPRRTPPNEIARSRRNKIGERIKILAGLMPWDKKMSMGAMLEDAHKYIRFLEAQVTALQTMPVHSAMAGPAWFDDHLSGRYSGLELLNRQQMLQILVNSSMIQNFLYKRECCVFSAEQVAELRRKMMDGRPTATLLLRYFSVSQ